MSDFRPTVIDTMTSVFVCREVRTSRSTGILPVCYVNNLNSGWRWINRRLFYALIVERD